MTMSDSKERDDGVEGDHDRVYFNERVDIEGWTESTHEGEKTGSMICGEPDSTVKLVPTLKDFDNLLSPKGNILGRCFSNEVPYNRSNL